MENEKVNFNDLFPENVQNIIGNIKMQCPTKKINLNSSECESLNAFGIALATISDEEFNNIKVDYDDLHNDTILYISPRVLMDNVIVINTVFRLFNLESFSDEKISSIPKSYTAALIGAVQTGIIEYKEFMDIIETRLRNILLNLNIYSDEVKNKYVQDLIIKITKIIWFIPYNEMDRIKDIALERFKNETNGEDNK